MAGREDWLAVARGADEDIRERILTGYQDGKPFTPYLPTLSLPPHLDTAVRRSTGRVRAAGTCTMSCCCARDGEREA